MKYLIYVSALTTLSIDDHNWVPTTDNRLLRRMIRDYKYRGVSAVDTIKRWPSVRRGEERWIFPYQENADALFNLSLIHIYRVISVSRAKYSIDYPAGFMLVASMNPCPCGYYNHPTKHCTCMPGQVSRYLSRISGPLMDRIDLQVEIMPVPFEELSAMGVGAVSYTHLTTPQSDNFLATNVCQPGVGQGMALLSEILLTMFFVLIILGATDERCV